MQRAVSLFRCMSSLTECNTKRSQTFSPIHHRQFWSFKGLVHPWQSPAEDGESVCERLVPGTSALSLSEISHFLMSKSSRVERQGLYEAAMQWIWQQLRANAGGVHSCQDLFVRKCERLFRNSQKYLYGDLDQRLRVFWSMWVGWENKKYGLVLLMQLSWSWQSVEVWRKLSYSYKLLFYYQSVYLYFCRYIFIFLHKHREHHSHHKLWEWHPFELCSPGGSLFALGNWILLYSLVATRL